MAVGAYPGSFDPPTVAHLAIAEAARRRAGLQRLDLVVSRRALGKLDVSVPTLDDRLHVLASVAASRPWLAVRVSEASLVADLAAGYDVVVLGADKWAQVLDPVWYGDSVAGRDEALARLPRVLVAPRDGHRFEPHPAVAVEPLAVPAEHASISSTRARAGRTDLMAAEAAAYDARTGAWTDPARYRRARAPR